MGGNPAFPFSRTALVRFEPYISSRIRLKSGDKFLLCSDGLSGFVHEARIGEIVQDEAEPESAVNRLVDEALNSGGRDNITVILAAVSDTNTPG